MVPFAGNPLDRAEHRRLDPVWLDSIRRDERSRALLFWDLKPRLIGDRLDWQPLDGLPAGAPTVFLGLRGDSARFAVDVTGPDRTIEPPEGHVDARAAAAVLSQGDSAIVAQGRSLLDWHARHGFCAVCGAASVMTRGGQQRVCGSERCRAEHFPRVDPVVIMLAIRDDRCLMGRQSRFPAGMVSALAGFMEPGETIEEAVRREIAEEVGLRIGEVEYVTSQPWPFPSNLMIGCFAEALDERITLDRNELEDARWYSRDEVRAALAGDASCGFFVPQPVAVAHHLLQRWLDY